MIKILRYGEVANADIFARPSFIHFVQSSCPRAEKSGLAKRASLSLLITKNPSFLFQMIHYSRENVNKNLTAIKKPANEAGINGKHLKIGVGNTLNAINTKEWVAILVTVA